MLASFIVTSLDDVIDATDGVLTLREAIIAANGQGGADTISFASDLTSAGPASIVLDGSELQITESLSINGPGRELLSIDARQRSRVLNIFGEGEINVALDGLTITGGRTTGDNRGSVGGVYDTTHGGGGIRFDSPGTLSLNRVLVTQCSTTGRYANGGGITTRLGVVTLTNSSVTGNSTAGPSTLGLNGFGGGINSLYGSVSLLNSIVSNNSILGSGGFGGFGAGIRTIVGDITLVDSTVSGNSITDYGIGGGIYSSFGDISLTRSDVSGNSIRLKSENPYNQARGGGIFSQDGNLTLTSSSVTHNGVYGASGHGDETRWHTVGGGISKSTGNLTLINSTVSGNTASGIDAKAGGIWAGISSVTVVNSTITNNSATLTGGGIAFGEKVTIHNSIVAGNTAATAADFQSPNDPATNLEVRFSLIGDNSTTTLIPSPAADANGNIVGSAAALIDPKLGPLQFNGGFTPSHALLSGSPAINAGDNGLVAGQLNDQRGAPIARVTNGVVDMGAYELYAAANPIVVSTITDELDDNIASGDLSLREAITLANGSNGDNTISFASSLFTSGKATIDLTLGELQVHDAVTIEGPGQDKLTVNAKGLSRVVNVFGKSQIDLALDRLTLTGGRTLDSNDSFNDVLETTHSGGGIRFNSSGSLRLTDSTITGNRTMGDLADGGGIFTESGTVILTGSTVSGNETVGAAADGGGIYTSSGAVTATRSIVSDNRTRGIFAFGGGIATDSGAVTLSSSTIAGNSTVGDSGKGGGIFSNTGMLAVSDSTISGNSTAGINADGGGIHLRTADLSLLSSTVSGNLVSGLNADGGGVYFDDAVVTIANSTITGNSTANAGGGLSLFADFSDKKLTIHNSIIAGNTADSSPDFAAPSDPSTNLDVLFSIIGNNSGTTLAESATADSKGNFIGSSTNLIDPKLGPLAANGGRTQTHALLNGSPALDAGNQLLIPNGITTDQRGVTRVIDLPHLNNAAGKTGLDIGSVEMVGVAIADARANESAGTISFVISLSHSLPIGATATVAFATADIANQAIAGTDYTAVVKNVDLVGGGARTQSVTVPLTNDSLIEPEETFAARIANATNAIITRASAIGTIGDDDNLLDYGDAPIRYPVTLAQNGARHAISTLFLGSRVDGETLGTPSSGADSDEGDDGVFVLSTLIATTVSTTSSVSVIASANSKLDAWIDFNGDGDWSDAGEQIFHSINVVAGTNILSFTVPAGSTRGNTGARFRLSSAGGLSPTGAAADGEVEDYLATIVTGAANAILAIDAPAGETTVTVQGSNLVVRKGTQVLSRAPFTSFGELRVNGSSLVDLFQITILEALATKKLVIDGGLGRDLLQLTEAERTLDLTSSDVTVRNVELIDMRGSGNNTLVVSLESVKAASPATGILEVISNSGDAIAFGTGWRAELPRFINGVFKHIISEAATGGTARVEVRNDRFFTNPLNRFDVDRNGAIQPLDALRIINALRRLGAGPFKLPTNDAEISTNYYDVSGENSLTALDALRVINALSRINRGGTAEGERALVDLDAFANKPTGQHAILDIAISEFEMPKMATTFDSVPINQRSTESIDDWMREQVTEHDPESPDPIGIFPVNEDL